MSWKYTSSFSPRDRLTGRDSTQLKYGHIHSGIDTNLDRWSGVSANLKSQKNFGESIEHGPVWARTRLNEITAGRKNKSPYENSSLDTTSIKRGDCKDSVTSKPRKFYGRSLTTTNYESGTYEPKSNFLDFQKKSDKSPTGSDSSSIDSPYLVGGLSKLIGSKASNSLNAAIVNAAAAKKSNKSYDIENEEATITMVTRGTSPTPTVSTVYLRSKRSDYGLEKKVPKRKKNSEVVSKETQTDREVNWNKYAVYGDSNVCPKGWMSYSDKPSPTRSRSSISKSHSPNSDVQESKRTSYFSLGSSRPNESIRGDESSDISTPDSPQKSFIPKPCSLSRNLSTSSGSSDHEKKIYKSNLGTSKNSLKLNLGKRESTFSNPSSPLQVYSTDKMEKLSPKVIVESCIDLAEASSASESSEEESSSEDESQSHGVMTVKKSVTNFLKNIPNSSSQNQSKSNSHQNLHGSGFQKVDFRKIESGERAWWMESTDRVGDENESTDHQGHLLPNLKHQLSPVNRTPSKNNDLLGPDDAFEIHDGYQGSTYIKGEAGKICGNLSNLARTNGSYSWESDHRTNAKKIQNGLGSPLEEKRHLDPGDVPYFLGKLGPSKSKTKLDVRKSSSREISPKPIDPKSEIELYWKELADSLDRPLQLCDLDFSDLNSDDETDILGNIKKDGEIPPPPPMLPLYHSLSPSSPGGNVPKPPTNLNSSTSRTSKALPSNPTNQIIKNKKTVKLFWKEVQEEAGPMKRNKEALIWDELKAVVVDTQKLEHLFESKAKDLVSKKQQDQNKSKEIIVLNPKRSNAINIGMTKLPPPRAIKAAILKMDSTVISKEGIEKVLTMLPTEEEKLQIQEAQNLNPDVPLGSAEQFLLTLASISQLEARLRLWAFKVNFENSEKEICEPLMDLKQGIEILRANYTFRGVLSTLLSVGNFLNGYSVKGFQIDYLSKVPEVKDTVNKHSLLHHLCIIVMEKFPDSTDLYSEIGSVTRASKVDFDEISANIKKLEEECKLSWNYLKLIAKHEGHTGMKAKMSDFLADCAERIIVLGIVHRRIINRFKKFAAWLGIPIGKISTSKPNEVFKTISEFALEYRTTRDRVIQQIKKINREKNKIKEQQSYNSNATVGRKINSKEANDDARLMELLKNETTGIESHQGSTWRRQRRNTKELLQNTDKNEEEIIETLIKTATQIPSSRYGLKEKRARTYGKYCKRFSNRWYHKTASRIVQVKEY